jgi:hypothetical protein
MCVGNVMTADFVKIRGYENQNKNKNNGELDSCNYSRNAIIEMPH